jgi:hypothetical protein
MGGSDTKGRPARHGGRHALLAANRFAAAIIGGYIFAYGFTAFATLSGFGLGLPLSDAQSLAWMTGTLVYLGAIVWAFVPRSTGFAWIVLGGGGVALGATAWLLSRWTI